MIAHPSVTRAPSHRLLPLGLTAVLALGAVVLPAGAAVAAPVVGGGGTFSYTEQDPSIPIGTGLTIGGGASYAGQYLQFQVTDAQGGEALSLTTDGSAATAAGVVSVVGNSVYLGNGTTADPVGSVDATLDGQGGRALRVNFVSAFSNSSFETGTLAGWTALNQRIDLGVTAIDGQVPTDTSTYPANVTNKDNNAPSTLGTLTTTVQSAVASDGTYGLRLESRGMTTLATCDVVHGPAVYSGPFEAAAGDRIYFDWRAYAGEDNFHVFGYLVDQTGNQLEVLDANGNGTTPWTTKETVIPQAGTYRFVFVSGTHDASCGRAAGASLVIDNVRVYGSKVTDSVVQQVARRLRYANASDTPAASRTVTVTAQSVQGPGTATVTVNITPVDDPPALGPIPTATFVNSEGAQSYATQTGTLPALDPESDPITFAIAGGAADPATVGGIAYTHSKAGGYGVLRLNEGTGAYAVVPDDDAIDARLFDDDETFTITATALGLSDTATLTLAVSVPPTPPGAPQNLSGTAGPAQVALSWSASTWPGGSATTSYRIESATDGVTWTTAAETPTAATSYTVTGLTNGVPVAFRVRATNATGTGSPSGVVTATPVDVPGAPDAPTVIPGDQQVQLSWAVPTDIGGTAVTGYLVESSSGGAGWSVVVADTAGTSYNVTGLPNGVPVSFRVSAINAVGLGPASAPAAATPRTAPGAPTDLSATEDDAAVTLSWVAPVDDGGAAITGYRVESSTDGSTWTLVVADATGPGYTVLGLTNGETRQFRVAATNVAGTGAFGAVVTATPRTVASAPTLTSVTPGNRTLTVEFTAPDSDGGAAITTYEYSLDGGATWEQRVTGTTESPLVIGGLVNGTAYSVLIRAVNEAGAGPASGAHNGTPLLQPVGVDADGSLVVPAGQSQFSVNGEIQDATVSTADGTWTMSGDGFSVTLAGQTAGGKLYPVDARGRLVVTDDGYLLVSGTGFAPGSTVDVWLFSDPVLLGEITVLGDGTFAARLALPGDIAIGEHTAQLNGMSDAGEARSFATGLIVRQAPRGLLAATGVDPAPLLSLSLNLMLLGAAALAFRRRRLGPAD